MRPKTASRSVQHGTLRMQSQVAVSNTMYEPRSKRSVFIMGSVLGIRDSHSLNSCVRRARDT